MTSSDRARLDAARCAANVAPPSAQAVVDAAIRTVSNGLALPFDAARTAYAMAVQSGLARRSILASRDLERTLVLMEQFALGPLARRV